MRTIIICALFLLPAVAFASDLNKEWEGKYLYACTGTSGGRPMGKAIRADSVPEAVDKLVLWGTRNNKVITDPWCDCAKGTCE